MEMTKYSGFLNEVIATHKKIDLSVIDRFILLMEDSFHEECNIFTFGNGGSGASASHFCEDLGKGTLVSLDGYKRFRVLSLTDNIPYILAWANDYGFETIFEQQIRNFGKKGDVAIGISCSGNSENVLRAIHYANDIEMTTVGFTGFNGGKLGNAVQIQIHVPSFDMGIVESIHISLMHYIVMVIKDRILRQIEKRD